MERQYLECLQFDINVSSSVYAKYYFELRYLAEAHDLILPLKLLDKQRALRLEVKRVLRNPLGGGNTGELKQGTEDGRLWYVFLDMLLML